MKERLKTVVDLFENNRIESRNSHRYLFLLLSTKLTFYKKIYQGLFLLYTIIGIFERILLISNNLKTFNGLFVIYLLDL